MTIAKKLDTFKIRDKFGLSETEIRSEALVAAQRRAIFEGWSMSKVIPSEAPPTIDGEYSCYSFDIYGVESGVSDLEEPASEMASLPTDEPHVAAKPENTA